MAKVEDFYLGATHVEIYDDCVVKTQEEVDAILKRCGEIWTAHLEKMARNSSLQAKDNSSKKV